MDVIKWVGIILGLGIGAAVAGTLVDKASLPNFWGPRPGSTSFAVMEKPSLESILNKETNPELLTTVAKVLKINDNQQIYYWVTTPEHWNGRFMVLYSGSAANHTDLSAEERAANQMGFATVSFDQLGFGFSSPCTDRSEFTLEKRSERLKRITDAERIKNPVLFGYSLGASAVVDYYARTHNGAMIILYGGSANFFDVPKWKEYSFRTINRSSAIGMYGLTSIYHFFTGTERKYIDFTNLKGKNLVDIWATSLDKRKQSMIAGFLSEGDGLAIEDQLKQVRIPLVTIHGKNDFLSPPENGIKILNLVKGPGYLEITTGGHDKPITDSKSLNAIIQKYLTILESKDSKAF